MGRKPDTFDLWFIFCAGLALVWMIGIAVVALHFIGKFW